MGTEVVARPVKRSGWKLWTAVAAGGGADPAEAVEEPRCEASAAGGSTSCEVTTATAVTKEKTLVLQSSSFNIMNKADQSFWQRSTVANSGRLSPTAEVPMMASPPPNPDVPETGVVAGGLLKPPPQHPPPWVVVGATA